jgi:hypothetical protein
MAGMLHSENEGSARRRKEKQESAKLRGKSKGRSSFDDQSNVNPIYSWAQKVTAEIERPFNMSRDEYLKVKHGYKQGYKD